MVYKFAARASGGAGWLLKYTWPLHLGISLGILLLFLMFDAWNWLGALVGIVAGNLATILIYWPQVRALKSRFALLGDQFLTLTESGVMVESAGAGARSFLPWSEVRRALVKHDMLILQQTNGLVHLLPIGDMPGEKVTAIVAEVRAHAGQTGGIPVPPPADLLTPAPMSSSGTPASHRELVDYLAHQAAPLQRSVCYLMLALFSTNLLISYLSDGAVDVVTLGLLLLFLCLVLSPGFMLPRLRRQVRARQVHVTPGAVLVVSRTGSWKVIPTRHFTRALQTRRCIHYIAPGFPTIVSVDGGESTPHLPQPRRRTIWPRLVALFVTLIGVPALVAGLPVLLDTPVGDEPVEYEYEDEAMTSEVRDALGRGQALAGFAESFMPPQSYPGPIIGCVVMQEDAATITLGCQWESGLEIWLTLPQ